MMSGYVTMPPTTAEHEALRAKIKQLEADKRELWEALKKARGIADPAHAFTTRHITLPMIDAVLAKHKEAK